MDYTPEHALPGSAGRPRSGKGSLSWCNKKFAKNKCHKKKAQRYCYGNDNQCGKWYPEGNPTVYRGPLPKKGKKRSEGKKDKHKD